MMFMVHSSTSSMPTQQSHPVGFNDQTYFDPFFATNNSEESLVPIPSDHSPASNSFQSPSPEHSNIPDIGRPSSATGQSQPPQPPHIPMSNGYKSSPSPHPRIENDAGSDQYGFLSPSQYLSDNGYAGSSEHTATPEFEGFYLEDSYGVLNNMSNESTLDDSTLNQDGLLNQITQDFTPPHLERANRPSLGTATLASSHLMSPVLTNTPDNLTRESTSSPPPHNSEIKQETLAGISVDMSIQAHHLGQMQQTPTATESSKAPSPALSTTAPTLARVTSPLIRVDQYARGDSPARQSPTGHGRRRSRASSAGSHLAVQNDADDEEDDEEQIDHRSGLDPVARREISDNDIANFKDQDDSSQRALKNADVTDWLNSSTVEGKAPVDLAPERPKDFGQKRRAKSTGAQTLSQANLESLESSPVDAHIPGPNVLIYESGGEEESEDDYKSASIDDSPLPSPTEGMNEIPGEARPGVYDELPNQPPLYRAKVWQDPLYDSTDPGVKVQPVTSNDAIQRFEQRARDIETLSRVATWGTRRVSESDLQSLFRRFTLTSEKNDEQDKKRRDRSSSFLQRFVPKRIPTVKRNESEKTQHPETARPRLSEHSRSASGGHRHESLTVPRSTSAGLKRMGSLGKRPKSPKIDTGKAVAAMAGPMAALGGGGPLSATGTTSPTGPLNAAKNVLKRSRSRSDLNNTPPGVSTPADPGIADLLRNQGGPPMPTLAAPRKEEPVQAVDLDDEDEEDIVDDHGVKMDLSIKSDAIVPTLEGFKSHVRKLNPRLPPYMFDRIAQEQLRRFKKLMDFKCKHVQAINLGKCSSDKHCTELGGKPTYLSTKTTKESEMAHTGFTVSGMGHSEDEANALAEGIVTAAQFPEGVPMPPVKRLPAEFECSLCFKVKKFQKPSDWSKHVHEDVQPFTCTFATCAEPKSFKRKADWVRHENERHRQLEWWQCNRNDCTHRCFRKDNFVQHLVREHKLPEPKVKTVKAGKPAVRGPSAQKVKSSKHGDNAEESHNDVDQVWRLVEECKRETPKNPKDETCKFCGNHCTSWKKLTVHLAKHMEQISMPVLSIVRQLDVTPDTIISPIEANRFTSQPSSTSPTSPVGPQSPFNVTGASISNMPAGFATISHQNGFFPSPQNQRVSPHTYPPPNHQQQLAAAYSQARGPSPHVAPNFNHYHSSPASQYTSLNSGQTYPPQTSTPEAIYNMRATSSQHRSSPFQINDSFQYLPQEPQQQPQQQAFASSPIEESMYQFGAATTPAPYQQTPPPTSYSQQTPMTAPGPTLQQQQQRQLQMEGMAYRVDHMSGYGGAVMNGNINGNMNGNEYVPSGHAAYTYQP